ARGLCDEYKILLICDEIATGFGRTGKMFACSHADVEPDIMCLGKAITGGYLSFAATLASRDVAMAISGGEAGVFMHGPTFMANPLACAAANASLELASEDGYLQNVLRIEKFFKQNLEEARQIRGVAGVRTLGAIGVAEMKEPVDVQKLQREFVARGVWIRPFGKLVYLMPPFVATDSQLQKLTDALIGVLGKNDV
ncbi:MAG: aminotransferase class III-fold pyridoxal phosphate-dependent enzyme, partial [Opitutales bacterium]|nr:aminotransferase class III-fold pyridoxal phosphate-dependent enzyme [Opitutales bacterium]